MSGITPQTPGLITSRQRGSWAGRGLLDSVHGLAFVGLALAEAGLILALVIELSDAAVIFPLLLIPPTLLARAAAGQRRQAAVRAVVRGGHR